MGHENVLSSHGRTLEFTTESFLTLDGNCILGVNASKACANLSPELKNMIRQEKNIEVVLEADNNFDSFIGWGHRDLELSSPISIVFRKSDFLSERTILINCSKVSSDINREVVEYMKDPSHQMKISFYLINDQENYGEIFGK